MACFDLLRNALDLLQLGDRVLSRLELMDQVLLEHHRAWKLIYQDMAVPKLHYVRHTVECMRTHGVNLSCFATERKHKFSKSIASFCFRRMTRSLLAHDIKVGTQYMKNVSTSFCKGRQVIYTLKVLLCARQFAKLVERRLHRLLRFSYDLSCCLPSAP